MRDDGVQFQLQRGLIHVPVFAIGTIVAVIAGLLLAGSPLWLIVIIVAAYGVGYLSLSEFWFRRLSYVRIGERSLAISTHSWGFLFFFGLLVPSWIHETIELTDLCDAYLAPDGRVRIEFWKRISGSAVRDLTSVEVKPVEPEKLLSEIRRRAPLMSSSTGHSNVVGSQ